MNRKRRSTSLSVFAARVGAVCVMMAVGVGCATRDLSIDVRDGTSGEPIRHVEVQVKQITPSEFTIHRFSTRTATTDDSGRANVVVPEVEWLEVVVITEQRLWVVFQGIGSWVWTPGSYHFADGRTFAGERVPMEIVVSSRE